MPNQKNKGREQIDPMSNLVKRGRYTRGKEMGGALLVYIYILLFYYLRFVTCNKMGKMNITGSEDCNELPW